LERQPSPFGSTLARLREAAGLSQYALAKRSGLSKQALSNLEMGAREPSWLTVQRLALALGVDCRKFTDPDLALPAPEEPRPVGRPRKADKAEAQGPTPKKRGKNPK
jgi:transcriptional regulator with XRE-family HTH domain